MGRRGEDEAAEYLAGTGHTILERNWRNGRYEIDIITLAEDGLHFVEVKSRNVPSAAAPEDNITAAKRRSLVLAAERFLHSASRKGLPGDIEIFFDVITVGFAGGGRELNYYPGAFTPIYV